MAKHASKSSHLQLVDRPKSVSVQVPLPVLGALAQAENAFFDLCVDVGQQVFSVLMEQDREALCGPKGKHDPARRASRAGSTSSDITLGGRRIPVRRLRARSQEERSTSKSAVSRRFVALSRKQMSGWLSAPLADRDIRVLVIDGIVFHDHTVIIVLGIDSDGKKHVLGLREGTTENSGVARALFRDLLERGLDPDRARLCVVDGSKALHAAIRKVFGRLGVLHRCQIHNILEHLPEHRQASVDRILREAWDSTDAELAKRRLERLASSLEAEHPGAAGSIREGLDETLTLQRLGIGGALYQTLRSTNTIENLNSVIATYTRNVKL